MAAPSPRTQGWSHLTRLQRVAIAAEVALALGAWGFNVALKAPLGATAVMVSAVGMFTYQSCLLLGVTSWIRTAAPGLWDSAVGAPMKLARRWGEVGAMISGSVYWLVLFRGFNDTTAENLSTLAAHALVQASLVLRCAVGGLTDRLSRKSMALALMLPALYAPGALVAQRLFPGMVAPYPFLDVSHGWGLMGQVACFCLAVAVATTRVVNHSDDPLVLRVQEGISAMLAAGRAGARRLAAALGWSRYRPSPTVMALTASMAVLTSTAATSSIVAQDAPKPRHGAQAHLPEPGPWRMAAGGSYPLRPGRPSSPPTTAAQPSTRPAQVPTPEWARLANPASH